MADAATVESAGPWAAIRNHSQDLRQALLELNELAAIPSTDSRRGQVQERISELSDDVIKRAIGIYTVLDKSGFAGAVAPLVPRTLPALSNGLPARERELLADVSRSSESGYRKAAEQQAASRAI